MTILELKKQIIQNINNADFALLNEINYVMKSFNEKSKVVAYNTNGKPLDKNAYINELISAGTELALGKVMSQEDIEHEVDKW